LLNFSGKAREVMTLAHELGHGVNGMLMRQQTFLNFDSPLTLAETASVFGEMLVFDYLKKQAKTKQEKLSLLSHRIEDAFATVFRQIGLFRFERLAHAARAKGEVSAKEFEEMWIKVQREMFGNSLTPAKGYEHWWVYISHFFHTPFYVYSYAFGQLLSLALYAQYLEKGQAMVAAYMHFLRAGGSKSPDELLAELGVDWSTPEFWQGGIDQMKEWVKEVKKL
jgi:oligoendopeptidase F